MELPPRNSLKIPAFHKRVFTLLVMTALLLAGMPAVVPASCSPAGCSHSCCSQSPAMANDADESGGCCSHQADKSSPAKNGHHDSGSTCACAGLCSTSACPVYADFGTYIPVPLLQAHLLPASLNPSDYISEEPQPPHVFG